MFYEEKVIDGVLHYRTSPDGDWRAKTAEQLTEMLETLSGNTPAACNFLFTSTFLTI